jgi:hypothetical protein
MKYYSQLNQDIIVDRMMQQKVNGTFLDVGASYFDDMNNTYFFEKERLWRGVAVEIDERYNEGWKNRPHTFYINEDALKVDYAKVLADNNMPDVIDYLSVDLEPPEVTYQAFCKIMETKYIFNVITFEVDYHRDTSTRDPARKMVEDKGYYLVAEIKQGEYHIDDVYVHETFYEKIKNTL